MSLIFANKGDYMERIYKPLEELNNEDIKRILEDNNLEEIISLPLSVGMYHPNWKFAQDLCVRLSEYPHPWVKANAVLGLAYVARTKRKLEKHIVKPVLLRALRGDNEFEWRAKDAIDDINLFMNWDIGQFALNKEEK
jgi:hypothetical protein